MKQILPWNEAMPARYLRLVLAALLLASATVSLGACEPRWGRLHDAVNKIF
jgi:hypothetical protein